jgi:tetratricopeptide (TPR) repeat protein
VIMMRWLAMLLLWGLVSVPASPGWAALSRPEVQALGWLENVKEISGPGHGELLQGIQQFQSGDFPAAMATLSESGRLGTGGPVEDIAAYLMGECRARMAATPQEVRAAIKFFHEIRRRFPRTDRALWALWRVGSLYRRIGLDYEATATLEWALRETPATSPFGPLIRLDLAESNVAIRRYAEAGKLFQVVMDMEGEGDNRGAATIGLGDVAYGLRRYSQAREYYKQAEAKWLDLLRVRPGSLLSMGETFQKLGEWPYALRVLHLGVNLHPRDKTVPLMLVRLADGYRYAGRGRAAKTLYETVLEANPRPHEELQAWVGLGELAEAEAQAGAGEKEVRSAYGVILSRWDDQPIAAEALFHLGQSYQREGDLEGALSFYDQLLARPDLGPWRVQTRKALEVILHSFAEARKALSVADLFIGHESVLLDPPLNLATSLVVGETLDRLGLSDHAAKVYRAVLAASPGGAHKERLLFVLAELHRKKGDLPHAEEAFQGYLRQFPKGKWAPEAQHGLLMLLAGADKRGEGEKTCRSWLASGALTYKPKGGAIGAREAGAALRCADLLSQAGDVQTAQGLYEGVLSGAKGEPASTDTLWASYQIGRGYATLGRTAEAAEFFGRVVKAEYEPLLAAVATVQLKALGFSEPPKSGSAKP